MVRYLNTIYVAAFMQLGWSSFAAAAFINLPLSDLFLRDDSPSCATNYTSCGSSFFQGSFCCSSDTTCLGLDSGSSVLCCPTGSNCTFIVPITCNVQSLNATSNPTAPIQSTRLNESLPTCADGCCPFGYTCAKNTTCVLDSSTSSEANSSSSASSSTATAMATTLSGLTIPSPSSISDLTPTTTPTPTPTSGIGLSSSQSQTTATCPQFPGGAVAAGFFPGAVAGALAFAIIMMCRRGGRQQNKEIAGQKTHRSADGAIVGISDPIPDEENGSFRTDFLLRRKLSGRYPTPGTVQSRSRSMIRKTGTRVKSIFMGTNNTAPSPQWNSATPPPPIPPIPAANELPVTPPPQNSRKPPRQPSTESIKVYSPPNMLGISANNQNIRNTTFSEVMEKAGFQNDKGEPSYRVVETPPVPPGNSPSRKK